MALIAGASPEGLESFATVLLIPIGDSEAQREQVVQLPETKAPPRAQSVPPQAPRPTINPRGELLSHHGCSPM